MMRIPCTIAAVVVAVMIPGADYPAGKEIAEVIVQGNRIHTREQIFAQIDTKTGAKYDPKTALEDVNRLLALGWFPPSGIGVSTQIREDGKVVVYFNVQELQNTIKEIVYRGAAHLSKDELDKQTNLKTGMPMNPAVVQKARQAILRKYQEQGRAWATVTILEGNNEQDTRVFFDIAEGPKTKIGSIEFEFFGPKSDDVGTERLRAQIGRSRALLGSLIGGNYSPAAVEQDIAKICELYHNIGCLDGRVQRELIWSDNNRSVKIIFHIDEGPRYKVNNLKIDGNKTFEPSDAEDPYKDILVRVGEKPGGFMIGSEVNRDDGRVKGLQPAIEAKHPESTVSPPKPGEYSADFLRRFAEGFTGSFMIGAAVISGDGTVEVPPAPTRPIPFYSPGNPTPLPSYSPPRAPIPASPVCPLGLTDVLQMTRSGIADAPIINLMRATNSTYQLTTEDIHLLQTNGVTQNVIDEMQNHPPAAKVDQQPVYIRSGPVYYVSPPSSQAVPTSPCPPTTAPLPKTEPDAMGLADVAALASSGVSDEVILNQMRTTGATFALCTEDILFLKRNKVSDRVVIEMQNTRARHDIAGTEIKNMETANSENTMTPLHCPKARSFLVSRFKGFNDSDGCITAGPCVSFGSHAESRPLVGFVPRCRLNALTTMFTSGFFSRGANPFAGDWGPVRPEDMKIDAVTMPTQLSFLWEGFDPLKLTLIDTRVGKVYYRTLTALVSSCEDESAELDFLDPTDDDDLLANAKKCDLFRNGLVETTRKHGPYKLLSELTEAKPGVFTFGFSNWK